MPWFKVDDHLHSHPKVLDVPLRAMGLWVKAGAWCSDQLTDGEITKGAVRTLGGTPADAKALVTAGLWEATDKGWRFHDWLDQNPSCASVVEQRNKNAEKLARWREQRRQERERVTDV